MRDGLRDDDIRPGDPASQGDGRFDDVRDYP
jgi:hypothetical protein